MEPLNIEKALQGHPVRLRNGEKAYIRYREVALPVNRILLGYWNYSSGDYLNISWNEYGENTSSEHLDIVGMWKSAPLVFQHWEKISRRFNYIAKDKDEMWWAYAEKPTQLDTHYDSVKGTDRTSLRALSAKVFPECDWNESIMERTE